MSNKYSITFYYQDGTSSTGTHPHKGAVLHREDGPALSYLRDGDYHVEEWWDKGQLTHRTKSLSDTIDEWFFRDGICHREDGPAHICYVKIDGALVLTRSAYYINGDLHRVGGKAVEDRSAWWDSRAYFIEGIVYSEEAYLSLMKEIEDIGEAGRLIDPRKWVRTWKGL